MSRCAIYVRLSKEDEEKQAESESIQNQKSILIRYAVEQGWDIFELYCDEDYSGADRHRPDFNRMLADAQAGRFQILLCKSQSRFTRDMELVEKYLHGLFPRWGIRFIAVADNADTAVRGNKKARQINGLINEWYLEDLSENIRMVFDMKRREGRYIGGRALYGYQKDPADKHHLLVDGPAAEVVRQIFRWSLAGHGKQHIARILNDRGVPNPTCYKAGGEGAFPGETAGLWNKTTVWRILRNEMYTGVMIQGRRKKVSYKSKTLMDVPEDHWYRVEGTHEAIIDKETFAAVQRGLALRGKPDSAGEVHILSGLVKCADCGATMSQSSNGRNRYLRCQQYASGGKERRCTRHSIRLDVLVDTVSERIRHHVQGEYTPGDLALPPRDNSRKKALEAEKRRLLAQVETRNRALKSLYLDKASGVLDAEQFQLFNQSFREEQERLKGRLALLDQEESHLAAETPLDLHKRTQSLLEMIPRELVALLIEKIEVGERDADTGAQRVTIHWAF